MNEQNKGRLNEKEDGRKSSKMKKRNVDTMRGGENMVEKSKELWKERKVIEIHIQTWTSRVLVKSMMKNYRRPVQMKGTIRCNLDFIQEREGIRGVKYILYNKENKENETNTNTLGSSEKTNQGKRQKQENI